MKRAGIICLSIAAVLAFTAVVAWARYQPEAWLEEYAALRAHMANHYANLDWMVQHRKIDLPRLSRDTQADLSGAFSSWQAGRALQRFITAFNDPHLKMVKLSGPPASGGGQASGEKPAGCAERGFHVRDRSFRFPFEQADGWKKAGGDWFPAGSFGDVAVLRIAHFGEDGYREVCDEVGVAGVRERLTQEVRDTIKELRARQARVLVVDISGNGGGTEWVTHVTKLLTSKPLKRPGTRMAEPACERSAIWEGATVCPGLVESEESTMQGEGAWDAPLAVLVDRRTASASEDMVVWLRESRAARIIGQPTYGAGCGYVRGGAPARLEKIGWEVKMPNCARFTSDGINEIEGITPDVELSLTEGSARERLAALVKALDGI